MTSGTAIFETARLRVRPLTESDRVTFRSMVCDARVMKYITGKPMTASNADALFDRYIHYYRDPENSFWVWSVIRKEDLGMIGTGALILKPGEIDRDLGYRLLPTYWKMGYAKELATGLMHYAFNQLDWPYVTADVDAENAASIKILRTLMKETGSEWLPEENCGVIYFRRDRGPI